MPESKITAKGQTTLPKAVREALGVKPGDRVRYVIRDGQVRIVALKPVDRLFGFLRYHGPPKSLEEMDQAITEAVSDI